MFNLPSFVFAGVAYQATSLLSTETIGIGVAIMGAVVVQQFLNLLKEGVSGSAPVALAAGGKSSGKLKLGEFSDRPPVTWTGRDPLNPIDTDF